MAAQLKKRETTVKTPEKMTKSICHQLSGCKRQKALVHQLKRLQSSKAKGMKKKLELTISLRRCSRASFMKN